MTVLHIEVSGEGGEFWGARGEGGASRVGYAELAGVLGEVLWFGEEVEPCGGGRARTTARNLLMFLSDVRGRRFKAGIFLGEDVLRAAEVFRMVCGELAAGRYVPWIGESGGEWRAEWRALGFLGREGEEEFWGWCVDAMARRAGRTVLEVGRTRFDSADEAWAAALRSDDGRVAWGDAGDLRDLARRVRTWAGPLAGGGGGGVGFELVAPEGAEGVWRVRLLRPVKTRGDLISLGQAAQTWGALRGMEGDAAEVSKSEAENFVQSGAEALRAAGFEVVLPEGLRGEHLAADVELESGEEAPKGAAGGGGKCVGAKLTVKVDGEAVTEAEVKFLLDQGTTMVFFRNRWIEVDRAILKEALRALRGGGKRLTAREALAFACGAGRAGKLRIERVKARGWLRGLLNELRGEERFRVLEAPAGLKGKLRDYQLRGYSWMAFLAKWGFGPCLADDMGLGKTIQTIAFILKHRETAARPALVVAPASVTTNWAREFGAFAPGLKVYLHQGAGRMVGATLQMECAASDVVVTGYSLLVKDFRDLSSVGFSALVLDEAQTVKNPDTKVSKAARALGAPVRVALTGTPVENSVNDLWALQEFLNPGLLGERKDFGDTYARAIKEDVHSGAVKKLRRIIEPFMLRRLKTDPGIAGELGGKHEVREYCRLGAGQRRAYEDALASYREDAEAGRGGARARGRMLALLTELKLICDGEGKMERLVELAGEIFANGESCLVFTQYAKVGKMLRERLREEFGREVPFLHGGLTAAKREEEIAAFNGAEGPAAFVLSLKAGGFGLNLTKATHVIHFDRWWNPAVENQATDRAHRIGQTRAVFVHKFICAGTLEDRIDALLESKKLLAGEVAGSGEGFLLKMGREEFEKVVALDAPEEDE